MKLLSIILSVLIISSEENTKIANKIWENECGATVEGLVHWNKGESFGSFGIGHFIWYPEGEKEIYEETFPSLLTFLKEKGTQLPSYLSSKGCLWSSYEEFLEKKDSEDGKALREFLYLTRELQAVFIQERQEEIIEKIKKELIGDKRETLLLTLEKVAKDPRGKFALIDYLNFKGSGLNPNERYKGEGWGLLQVLLGMDLSNPNIMKAFTTSAKERLKQRVKNSPKERGEKRWLKGWNSRVDGYLEGL